MQKVLSLDIDKDTGEIMKYLLNFYPEHFEYLSVPPLWVSNVKRFVLDDETVLDRGRQQAEAAKHMFLIGPLRLLERLL